MRIKTRWHRKGKEHSVEETASALAFIAWRIGQASVLNMENENYQTDTLKQRLEIIFEFTSFLIHMADRITYHSLDEEERVRFITAMAQNTLRQMRTNLNDYGMSDDEVNAEYLPKINERMSDYADFDFNDEKEEPSFNMRRYLGEKITALMGERDNKWVSQQVMDIEVPKGMQNFKKGFKNLFPREEV